MLVQVAAVFLGATVRHKRQPDCELMELLHYTPPFPLHVVLSIYNEGDFACCLPCLQAARKVSARGGLVQ